MSESFPELLSPRELRRSIDAFVDRLVENYADVLDTATRPLVDVLVWLEQGLRAAPWWSVLLAVAALSWLGSRKWSLTLIMPAMLAAVGAIGLWDQTMQTLALMIVATGLSILIGLPTGIVISRSALLRRIVLPLLDVMQTMPSFVYLIPVVMLFGLGKIPAIIATVVYAVPPLIRLTDLGIRLVDKEVLEASVAFGANRWQQLFGVQLPLAMPNIMAGINQTTMMALAMVVVASMIGARGLGQEVLIGINRLEVGRGMLAGLGIVVLAILFDRVTQAWGARSMRYRTDGQEGR